MSFRLAAMNAPLSGEVSAVLCKGAARARYARAESRLLSGNHRNLLMLMAPCNVQGLESSVALRRRSPNHIRHWLKKRPVSRQIVELTPDQRVAQRYIAPNPGP